MFPSLNLFQSVISGTGTDFYFLSEYGVIVAPSASHKLDIIKNWLSANALNGIQLNSSFHKSWNTIKNKSTEELVVQQMLHYFSSYGLEKLGVYDDSLIYIPREALDLPERLSIKVIYGMEREELISRCLKMLSSGVALKKESIEDIFAVLDDCGYTFTGNEIVKNREAELLIIDRLGKFPEDPMTIFRYLVYKATGETLLIKNDRLIQLIKTSRYALPDLSKHEIHLASHYNRLKPLWLAFKANDANAAIVNRISRLSKKHHKTQPVNVLSNIGRFIDNDAALKTAIVNGNIFQLIRAFNSLTVVSVSKDRFYRIRNGKGYAKETSKRDLSGSEVSRFLLDEIKYRLTGRIIYIPENIDYAFPVSEKQFIGMIPYGTRIFAPKSDDFMLTGIYWEGSQIDLDLRADGLDESVGWNTGYKGEKEGLLYSGDITSAPNGATEFLYSKKITSDYLVKVNGYRAEDNQRFKIIIGSGKDITPNYIIDPNKIIFEASLTMLQQEMSLGVLSPRETEGVDFYFVCQGSGENRVGSSSKISSIACRAIANQTKGMLRLRDVFPESQIAPTPEEADIDLSVSKLTKSSFFNLFFQ